MRKIETICDICGIDCTSEGKQIEAIWDGITTLLDHKTEWDICLNCWKKMIEAVGGPELRI